MTWLQPSLRYSLRVITAIVLLAHLCAAGALVAFGWRVGGFALNGPAVCVYLVLSALASVAYLVNFRRTDPWAQAAHITLIPWLALVAAGVWYATAVFGASYAPYGVPDDAGLYPLVNAAFALVGCGLALGLRWPRLLLTWIMAHGLVLLLSVGILGPLALGALASDAAAFAPWVFVPLVYGLAGLALGWRPAWRARGEWVASLLEAPPNKPVWMAFVGAALFGAWLAGSLLSPERLPQAGEVQAWISSTHVVPLNAWLPTLVWSAWLFMAARWLLVPVVLLGLLAISQGSLRLTIRPATLLLWSGLAALIAFGLETLTPIGLIANVVTSGIGSLSSEWGLLAASPFVLIMGWLVVAQLWERPLSARGQASLALLILGLLALLFGSQLGGAWVYARFLFFPIASWTGVAEYAPVSPALLASLGLALHLIVITFGMVLVWLVLQRVRAEWALAGPFWSALRLAAGTSAAALLALAVVGYELTAPRPTRVVPAPGAARVPLDTLILLEFAPPSGLDSFLASGFVGGFQAHYLDTGELIEGTTGIGGDGIIFQPAGPLRSGASVEASGRWSDKQSYVFRFTTAGQSEPAATPLALPTQWPRPVPTAAALK